MADDVRDIEVVSEASGRGPERIRDYRRRWAVVVGVRSYGDASRTGLSSLKNAANDACRIYRLLTREYGFDAMLLCRRSDVTDFDPELQDQVRGNGSRAEIIDAIDAVGKKAGPEDLFVFFYSGHGTDEGKGYLVPYGAKKGDHATYLMYPVLEGALSALPCRHHLLLVDGCYAGIATRDSRDITSAGEAGGAVSPGQNLILLADRFVALGATSAFEVAPDGYLSYKSPGGQESNHSPFTEALAGFLETRVGPGEGVTVEGVFAHVHERVTVELLPNGCDGKTIHPVMSSHGDGRIMLYRPGMRIHVPRRVAIDPAGVTELGPYSVEGGTPPV
jgi:hypothetical protein